jgi:hypothetical protein
MITAACIADAIIRLVETSVEPVTFSRVAREIPGFAGPPYYDVRSHMDKRKIFWTNLTEDGRDALTTVLNGRVALEATSPLPYLLDGNGEMPAPGADENGIWVPLLLHPAKTANLALGPGLFRVPRGALPAAVGLGGRVLDVLHPLH